MGDLTSHRVRQAACVTGPVRITVLVENTAAGRGLLAEHGLSFWIEAGPERILFDTGQTDVFARNAKTMGIDPTSARAIVLSHGHYDHTGGLADAMRLAPRARVFLHPEALKPRFSRHADGTRRDVGLPGLSEQDIRSRCAELVMTEQPTEVAHRVFVTGAIPRRNSFEDVGAGLFQDAACTQPDALLDDQAMYFGCSKGIVVLLGCAHAGVVNTINHIRTLTDGAPIRAILGGMHLAAASDQRLAATLEALQEHEDPILAPAHCTGAHQTMRLRRRDPDRWRECRVGSQFVFE